MMAPDSWASSANVRKSMQSNRSRDTQPELAVRRLLHARGLRYRVNARPLKDVRRTADIVFGPSQVAVFIDGCFWHACPDHYAEPKSNVDFWKPKISGNAQRDLETNDRLRAEGWTVLRFWTHETAADIAQVIESEVLSRRHPG